MHKLEWHLVQSDLDRARLISLVQVIWPEVFTPIIGQEQVAYMLKTYQDLATIDKEIQQGAKYWLLMLDDQAVGYTAYEDLEDYLYLSKLYLSKSVRGQGLMTEVFRRYLTLAKGKKIRLNVNKRNSQAIAIYEHWGFKKVGERSVDIGQNFIMDDDIYEKETLPLL